MGGNDILRSKTSSSGTDSSGVGVNEGHGNPGRSNDDPVDREPAIEEAFHRARLYSLLSLGFERPGEELGDALADGSFVDHLLESAAVVGDDVLEAARTVSGVPVGSAALASEWASLFGVEEGITVSPYELTYLPGPLVTNVRQLADISGFYSAFGLSIAEGQNDRGDHLCFQTEFLGHLSVRETYLREEGDREGVRVVADARGRFLEDHLGRWYWRFADEVATRDRGEDSGFYAALADLLAALVEREVDRLDLDPDWVPDDPEVTEWTEDIFGDSGRGCGGCGLNAGGDQPEQGRPDGHGRSTGTPTTDERPNGPGDS